MITIDYTPKFIKWYDGLKDRSGRANIASRLDRMAYGHEGDVKSVGHGVYELRIHISPGYRLYFCRRGDTIIVLLCGGDKSTQTRDIKTAIEMAKDYGDTSDER